MTAYSLDQILSYIVKGEKDLYSFYSLMENHLNHKSSVRVLRILKAQQQKVIEIVDQIKMKECEHANLTKCEPDYLTWMTPEFSSDSSAFEIFNKILHYEEELKGYYEQLRNIMGFSKSREVFDLLVQLKTGQIKEIETYMDNLDLILKPH